MISTDERLSKILARCRANLALAEKRTPLTNITRYDHGGGRVFNEDTSGKRKLVADYHHEEDREYALACAGAAEAGWRSTIAAIHSLKFIIGTCKGEIWVHGRPSPEGIATNLLAEIIAAWPEALL